MATDLSLFRLRELMQSIWEHCEPILPNFPADKGAFTSADLKNRLRHWSHPCAVVAAALDDAAIWCDTLDRPDDANWLREAGNQLTQLWHSTYSNYTSETMTVLAQRFENESLDEWLERLGTYNGSGLACHIYRVSGRARSILQSLESIEAQHKAAELTGATCHVTLRQMAGIVSRDKRTLERLAAKTTFPLPAVKGGGGKPHEWRWSDVRAILVSEFGRSLPEVFPADQFVKR